jgi:DNA-binding NarL/FixJ family response regulator
VSIAEFSSRNPVRSCFRCGQEFRQNDGQRICPACQALSSGRKKSLNPQLSFREQQVIHIVAQGKLNKEIAYELHLTEGTIKEYLNRIFRKLGISNRTELAVWALTQGMLNGERVA